MSHSSTVRFVMLVASAPAVNALLRFSLNLPHLFLPLPHFPERLSTTSGEQAWPCHVQLWVCTGTCGRRKWWWYGAKTAFPVKAETRVVLLPTCLKAASHHWFVEATSCCCFFWGGNFKFLLCFLKAWHQNWCLQLHLQFNVGCRSCKHQVYLYMLPIGLSSFQYGYNYLTTESQTRLF